MSICNVCNKNICDCPIEYILSNELNKDQIIKELLQCYDNYDKYDGYSILASYHHLIGKLREATNIPYKPAEMLSAEDDINI